MWPSTARPAAKRLFHNSSPLMREGWGEGDKPRISPLIPPHAARVGSLGRGGLGQIDRRLGGKNMRAAQHEHGQSKHTMSTNAAVSPGTPYRSVEGRFGVAGAFGPPSSSTIALPMASPIR